MSEFRIFGGLKTKWGCNLIEPLLQIFELGEMIRSGSGMALAVL
jgi:hypothetical protein